MGRQYQLGLKQLLLILTLQWTSCLPSMLLGMAGNAMITTNITLLNIYNQIAICWSCRIEVNMHFFSHVWHQLLRWKMLGFQWSWMASIMGKLVRWLHTHGMPYICCKAAGLIILLTKGFMRCSLIFWRLLASESLFIKLYIQQYRNFNICGRCSKRSSQSWLLRLYQAVMGKYLQC
jgi:hypothetical protein